MKIFNLEERYQQYLTLCGLKEENMAVIQRTETRRAFYGGCGIMFRMMGTDLLDVEEDDKLYKTLESIENQIKEFWDIASTNDKSNMN